MNQKKILIFGVTACGKSGLAFELAKKLKTDIVSIDSMKVYKRMNIGTAKPTIQEQEQIKYHIIDVVQPSDSFSVDRFLKLANKSFDDLSKDNKPILAEGGTAMYIKAMLWGIFDGPGSDSQIRLKLKEIISTEGLEYLHQRLAICDPDAAQRIHPNDEKRIIRALEVFELTGKPISSFQNQFDTPAPKDWIMIGLKRDKEIENSRINARVKLMINQGLVDEVQSLLKEELPISQQAASAIGYAEIIAYLKGKINLEEAVEKIKINTRRLAKSQRTWFKRFENVHWFDLEHKDSKDIIDDVIKILDYK